MKDIPVAHSPSWRRPAVGLLVAAGVLLVAVGLALHDATGANRPHELRKAPWVAGITLLNLVPSAVVLVALVRRVRGRGWNARVIGLLLGGLVVAGLNTLILVGALSLLPEVLGR